MQLCLPFADCYCLSGQGKGKDQPLGKHLFRWKNDGECTLQARVIDPYYMELLDSMVLTVMCLRALHR